MKKVSNVCSPIVRSTDNSPIDGESLIINASSPSSFSVLPHIDPSSNMYYLGTGVVETGVPLVVGHSAFFSRPKVSQLEGIHEQ